MRSPLLSRDLIFEGLFFKNWGWASSPKPLTKISEKAILNSKFEMQIHLDLRRRGPEKWGT